MLHYPNICSFELDKESLVEKHFVIWRISAVPRRETYKQSQNLQLLSILHFTNQINNS